jgi:hypothetical protein
MPDGSVHCTGTLHGTFSADLVPTDGVVDFTGSFVEWFGGQGALLEQGGAAGRAVESFVLNGQVTVANGSSFRIHENAHTVYNAAGLPALTFDKAVCP